MEVKLALLRTPTTRYEAMQHIQCLLNQATEQGFRLLCGFDFPFGYPEGTARMLTDQDHANWEDVWNLISGEITDCDNNWNDRFEAAARLNKHFDGEGPFGDCLRGGKLRGCRRVTLGTDGE